MIFVVEIANKDNERATKEYEAKTLKRLTDMVQYELSRYPKFRLVNAWPKDHPDQPIFILAP